MLQRKHRNHVHRQVRRACMELELRGLPAGKELVYRLFEQVVGKVVR
jgi:hypothetical protein